MCILFSTMYSLNSVAGRLLESIGQGRSLSEIIEEFGQEYDIDVATLERDLNGGLRELVRQRLLVERSS